MIDPAVQMLRRIAGLPRGALLGAAGLVFVGLSLWEMYDETVTTDELVHLAAGATYVKWRDYRLNPEHPPLAKMLAALPLGAMDLRQPSDPRLWDRGLEWQYGYNFLFLSGNDSDRILFWARLVMIFWGLLLLGSVYALSRELFGTLGGLISLTLATFSPMILGHAHLVTTDVPVAVMLLLTAIAFRRLAETPSLGRALTAGLLLGGALSVKYSAVLFVPAFAWYLLTVWTERRGLPGRGRSALRWAACLATLVAAIPLVIWGTYGFRYRAAAEPGFEFAWAFEGTGASLVGRTLDFVRRHHLLPEAFVQGFWYMFENAQGRSAYAAGMRTTEGWWWYFPFAFVVKTPVSALVLLIAGTAVAIRQSGARGSNVRVLIIPVIIYWVVSLGAKINIGLRHLMPVFPFMMVLAGGLPFEKLLAGSRSGLKGSLLVLLMLVPLETLVDGRFFIAYFNLPSTALAPRHRILTDSNLDWGQDLRRLKAWMDARGIDQIKLAYFGNGSPRALGLRHVRLVAANMYQQYETEWPLTETLLAGDWVAVSATNYAGVVLGPRWNHFPKVLAGLNPVAAVGHSILVFHLPAGWSPP